MADQTPHTSAEDPDTEANPSTDGPPYTLSFSMGSPDAATFLQSILNLIEANDGVNQISIAVESTQPFEAETMATDGIVSPSAVGSDDTESEMTTSASAESTAPSEGVPESVPTEVEVPSEGAARDSDSHSDDADAITQDATIEAAEADTSADVDGEDELAQEEEQLATRLSPDTWAYRVLLVVESAEGAQTSAEVEAALEQTSWPLDKSRVSTELSKLYQDGIVDRQQRTVDRQGRNPYEYWLSDLGQKILNAAESEAKNLQISYPALTPGEPEAEAEPEPTAAGEATADESADDEDDTESEFLCEECGKTFKNKGALGSHTYHQHRSQSNSDEEDKTPENMTLKPDTYRFQTAATLYTVESPVTPREMEELLDGTDWERDRARISGNLGTLAAWGVAQRSQREESGKPYEYTLTDAGLDRVQKAITEARSNDIDLAGPIEDAVATAEETAAEDGDGDGATGDDEDTGLDVLFTDDEDEDDVGDIQQFPDDESEANEA